MWRIAWKKSIGNLTIFFLYANIQSKISKSKLTNIFGMNPMSWNINIWHYPRYISIQHVHIRIVLIQICKIHCNLQIKLKISDLSNPLKTGRFHEQTYICVFGRHWEVAFHAWIFGCFLRRRIIFNHIPKPHHIIYIEISHRFHLKIKTENGKVHVKKKCCCWEHNANWKLYLNMWIFLLFILFRQFICVCV